jgi:uncharacterized protein YndB with AHSA1/START domain
MVAQPSERRVINSPTDRIEKRMRLRSPRARVWTALTDSKEFGAWFRAEFTEPFHVGSRHNGRITYPGYEHLRFDLVVETIEPQHRFSFRWHPNAIDPKRDYSAEPMTLVEFTLTDDGDGTLLIVRESGFDRIPLDRRAEALKNNDRGWAAQMTAIEEYLRHQP